MTKKRDLKKSVVSTYIAIEKGVVGGYKAIESGVVGGYKAVESATVEAYKSVARTRCITYIMKVTPPIRDSPSTAFPYISSTNAKKRSRVLPWEKILTASTAR